MNEHTPAAPFDFSQLNPRSYQTKRCSQCGRVFTTRHDNDLCEQCQYYADNPDQAPKYFTWHQRSSGWHIRATWPDKEPLPEPGDQVTVHRKNGSTSVETVREVEGLIYLPDGRGRLDCYVA